MSEQDRLDRLERRVASLEQLMRRMMASGGSAAGIDPDELAAPPVEPPVPAAVVEPVTEPPRRPAPEPLVPAASIPRRPKAAFDGEQWVGQRGLLAVGVIAVVLAAGYLLKLSFDRGWISPLLRVISGAITGTVIAGLGWVIDRRGYRTYGPALMGLGAAILYTVIWAASTWYGFIAPVPAVLAMAAVSLLLAGGAWLVDQQWLGATAAVGVFIAPITIDQVDPNPDRLLAYLATMGLVLGTVAWKKGWRINMLVVAASYFGIGVVASDLAWDPLVLTYGAVGGAAGMAVGLWRRWWETRFLAFSGGWGCLAMGASDSLAPYVLLAGIVLAWPVWDHSLRTDATWPFANEAGERPFLPSFYFYLTPLGLTWAVGELQLQPIQQYPGLAAALVAAAYFGVGVRATRRQFALVAMLLSWWAVAEQWDWRAPSAGVFGVLAVLYGTVARATTRRDWGLFGLLTLVLGVLVHWGEELAGRPPEGPAFIDGWAMVFWGLLVVTVAFANAARQGEGNGVPRAVTGGIWALAGLELLAGVTAELLRYFDHRAAAGVGSSLAAGLAVSAWWLLFAGGAVWLGFRRGLKPVRVAGLLVSGMAIVKVVFVDLSNLDALYRIGSVFLLGLVSLLVAWGYHQSARAGSAGEG